jgi:hypothetical protein
MDFGLRSFNMKPLTDRQIDILTRLISNEIQDSQLDVEEDQEYSDELDELFDSVEELRNVEL